MSQLSNTTVVEISAEMRAKLEALEDSPINTRRFTPETDAILLEYWTRKRRPELAKLLGFSDTTLRKRYKELTDGN
jgi:transcription initiation factor TFIIIB Brf1 subunit/transcription initiation factor TFIIB